MATANDLYAMQPEAVTNDVWRLKGYYYNHIPEVTDDFLPDIETDRVEMKLLKDHCFDGRRTWALATVWFDGNPVMVIQNAGREGDDHAERFITDKDKFDEMCAYIRGLIPREYDRTQEDVFDKDADIPELTYFYGNSLYGEFETY